MCAIIGRADDKMIRERTETTMFEHLLQQVIEKSKKQIFNKSRKHAGACRSNKQHKQKDNDVHIKRKATHTTSTTQLDDSHPIIKEEVFAGYLHQGAIF